MIPFTTYNWRDRICFKKGKTPLEAGETILYYLNLSSDTIEAAEKLLAKIEKISRKLDYNEENSPDFNKSVFKAQSLICDTVALVQNMPPYNQLQIPEKIRSGETIFDLLNHYYYLFSDMGEMETDQENYVKEIPNEDNLFKTYENGFQNLKEGTFELTKFELQPSYLEEYESQPIYEYERDKNTLINNFKYTLIDIIRVRKTYDPVLCMAAKEDPVYVMEKAFRNTSYESYSGMNTAANTSISYDVIEEASGNRTLCKQIEYKTLGAFLYTELMNGIESQSFPRKCKNCGRFFLQKGGYSSEYCDNIAPGETDKTCKEVGARNTFEDKIKTDPVWLLHQRAYKTHYARMKKKNMTQEEFLLWSDEAREKRDACLSGKISLIEYKNWMTSDLKRNRSN